VVLMGGAGSGKPQGELMILDGHELINGKLEKTDFFNFLGVDLVDYSGITLTPEQALAFKNSVVRMSHGVGAAIPLQCSGANCFNKYCVFHTIGTYPLSKPCLFETRVLQYLTKSYIEDIGVDPNSPTEMVLINKLVELDIIDFRANLGLSGVVDDEAGQLLKTNVVENEQGVISETTVLHPLLEAKEKADRTRLKILEALVGTRREKYKKAAALKTKDENDSSNMLADMKAEFEEMKQATKNKNLNRIEDAASKVADIINADWELKDSD